MVVMPQLLSTAFWTAYFLSLLKDVRMDSIVPCCKVLSAVFCFFLDSCI